MIGSILKASCEAFGTTYAEVMSTCRKRSINYTRKCIVKLLREQVVMNGRPIPYLKIAEIIGFSDHSTAMCAHDAANDYTQYCREFQLGYTAACDKLGVNHNVNIMPEPDPIIGTVHLNYKVGSPESITIGKFLAARKKSNGKLPNIGAGVRAEVGALTREECLAHMNYVLQQNAA